MATVTPTFDVLPGNRFNIIWAGMAPGDVGDPVEVSNCQWRACQVVGSLPAAVASFEGSNDGVNWSTIISGQIASAAMADIGSRAQYLQPTADLANTGNIDVILHCSN